LLQARPGTAGRMALASSSSLRKCTSWAAVHPADKSSCWASEVKSFDSDCSAPETLSPIPACTGQGQPDPRPSDLSVDQCQGSGCCTDRSNSTSPSRQWSFRPSKGFDMGYGPAPSVVAEPLSPIRAGPSAGMANGAGSMKAVHSMTWSTSPRRSRLRKTASMDGIDSMAQRRTTRDAPAAVHEIAFLDFKFTRPPKGSAASAGDGHLRAQRRMSYHMSCDLDEGQGSFNLERTGSSASRAGTRRGSPLVTRPTSPMGARRLSWVDSPQAGPQSVGAGLSQSGSRASLHDAAAVPRRSLTDSPYGASPYGASPYAALSACSPSGSPAPRYLDDRPATHALARAGRRQRRGRGVRPPGSLGKHSFSLVEHGIFAIVVFFLVLAVLRMYRVGVLGCPDGSRVCSHARSYAGHTESDMWGGFHHT